MLITTLPLLDRLLQDHATELGADRTAYRNHCYRLVNVAVALSGRRDEVSLQQLSVAAAFHDLGIWTDNTFDYLDPSERRALVYLDNNGLSAWTEEVGAMIREHHRIRSARASAGSLAEAFRKADWLDVSLGLLRFGLAGGFLRELRATFPNAGFHKRLVQLSLRRLLSHPWNPLPMLRF